MLFSALPRLPHVRSLAATWAALAAFTVGFAETPLRLGSNENPWGFSPKAAARMQAALTEGNYYNRDAVEEMVDTCATKEGVRPDYILPTPGSGPVLLMTAAAYGKPGVNVVTTAPGYTQLTSKFAEFGGSIKYVSATADQGQDFKAMLQAIDDQTAIVYVCNPNNPTGVLAQPAELREFVLKVPAHILVFVDEAYLELADTGLAANTMAPLTKVRKNLLISRTFSKGYGMAGLRAGYGVGHPEVLEKLKKFSQGGPSFLAALAATEAVKDDAHLESNRTHYRAVREYTCKELDKMGIAYASPQGAFIYFKSGVKSTELVAKMRAAGILISGSRATGTPEGAYDEWARVSIGKKEDMDLFLGELTKILGKS